MKPHAGAAATVLVAEDNPKQARLVEAYLRREGHRVTIAADGRAALDHCRDHRPDLVVLDVMLPAIAGLDVCRLLRAESDIAILMLTARTAEEDMLRGLDAGADDYLAKPFSPRELTARVRALLRRSGAARDRETPVVRVGGLEIDAGRFEVRVDGRLVTLTAKEFAVLEVLAAAPGRAFSRAQIIERAFEGEGDMLERTVDAHVMNLRRKLGDDPADARHVQTVYGRGYRLAARS